jgi:hypothetical protein
LISGGLQLRKELLNPRLELAGGLFERALGFGM